MVVVPPLPTQHGIPVMEKEGVSECVFVFSLGWCEGTNGRSE